MAKKTKRTKPPVGRAAAERAPRPAAGSAAHAREGEERLRALALERTRVGLVLTAAVFAVYFGFIAAVAYARPLLGTLVAPGLSVGILVGALVIVASWLLTWAYVHWANTRYDPALRALKEH
jgi:uncharacterized membrane protein (DUF485 family)